MTAALEPPQQRWAWPRRAGIGMRLLLAQIMVLGAGALTTELVAAFVGPPLFREHLHRAGVAEESLEQMHAEEAYRYATALSVGVALAVSVLTALAVSWYMSRRLQRSVTDVASAATAISNGQYDIRVGAPGLGQDFDTLAHAFNEMAARLRSVDATRRRLFSDLAHEIRTPISVLEAYIEALEDGVRDLTPDTAAMLRDQTARLVRFSADLAALAHAEEAGSSLHATQVDIRELVHATVATAHDRYRVKGVTLTSHMLQHVPSIGGDPQRLAQILNNLLDNALRHTPPGGRVDVRVGAGRDTLTVEVVDSGEGIAAEHLPHLFERFYRADTARDREHGGAGIGLAIAKALAEAHHGHLVAASDGPGAGATFSVILPTSTSHRDVTSPEYLVQRK